MTCIRIFYPLSVFCGMLLMGFYSSAQLTTEDYFVLDNPDKNYDTVARYTVSLAVKNGKWGLMNVLGEWYVQPVYDEILTRNYNSADSKIPRWEDGVLIVAKAGKYGAVNCFGKEILPCMYKEVEYNWGIFMVSDFTGKFALIDRNGKVLKPLSKKYPGTFKNGINTVSLVPPGKNDYNDWDPKGNYALINSAGDTILKVKNSKYMISGFEPSEGFTAFNMYPIIPGGNGSIYGSVFFVNSKGKMIDKPRYSSEFIHGDRKSMSAWEYVPAFHHGRALVFEGDTASYIDTTGKQVITFENKPALVNARNDFNESGLTMIHYSSDKNKYQSVYEVIDTLGRSVMNSGAGNYAGGAGIVIESIKYDHTATHSTDGVTILDKNMKHTAFFPKKDDNYRYFISTSFVAGVRLMRESLATKEVSHTIVDWNGKLLYPWLSTSTYFDPLTGISFSKKGTRGLQMKESDGKLLFECDTCFFRSLYDFEHYTASSYHVSNGIYEIQLPGYRREEPNKQVAFVNYKGVRLETAELPFKTNFMSVVPEMEKYTRKYEAIKISFRQKELDEIYKTISWNPVNKKKATGQ